MSQRRQRHDALRRLALRRGALWRGALRRRTLGPQRVVRELCSQDIGRARRPRLVVTAAALGTARQRMRVDVLHEGRDVRQAREREQ